MTGLWKAAENWISRMTEDGECCKDDLLANLLANQDDLLANVTQVTEIAREKV